jgi:hypothetical protein
MNTEQSQAGQALRQVRQDEALAFFQVNQAGRNAAERVMALFLTVVAIAGSVGVAAKTADVVLPLPPLLLLLLSYMFQQYADLTVIGTARRRLEDLVNHEIGGDGLIYESTVAPIRKMPPLSRSMRAFQYLIFAIVSGTTIFGGFTAIRDHDTLITVSFGAATFVAAASCIYSFVQMNKSEDAATEKMTQGGLGDRRGILISVDLYREALDRASKDEMETQTFERLLKTGLSNSE